MTEKASAGDTGTFNLVHGTGSMFGNVPNSGGNTMPWFIEKRDDEWCVIKGTRDDPGESEGCHPTEDAAKAQMAALYANMPEDEKQAGGVEMCECPECGKTVEHEAGTPCREMECPSCGAMMIAQVAEKQLDEPDRFFVYKAADGTPRWAAVSSVAVKDKEFEIVTEKAQDDAIEHARDTGNFGELDLVHVAGTDVGKCDMMARAGKRLIESGTWDDSDLARRVMKAVQERPEHWGISIKFVYDPAKFDGERYHGNIRIRKRTILPQEMAASFGTRIVAMSGGESMKEISEDTRQALKELGVSEDEIEALAEKSLTPDEPNTVEKQEEPEATEPAKVSVWERLKTALSNLFVESEGEPNAEPGGVEEATEVEPAEEAQEEKQSAPEMDAEQVQKLAEAIAAPLVAKLAEMNAELESVKARLAEAEGVVEDKIINKLLDLPPVVKVRASQVDVTAVEPEKPQTGILPQARPDSDNYVSELMKGVTEAVTEGINAALPKAQI